MEDSRCRRLFTEAAKRGFETIRCSGGECYRCVCFPFATNRFLPLLNSKPVIESISSNRDPQPEFEAMYLLMPTTHNVNRIIKDFTNHKQYAAAHLFFIEGDSFSYTFPRIHFDIMVMKDSLSPYSNI